MVTSDAAFPASALPAAAAATSVGTDTVAGAVDIPAATVEVAAGIRNDDNVGNQGRLFAWAVGTPEAPK